MKIKLADTGLLEEFLTHDAEFTRRFLIFESALNVAEGWDLVAQALARLQPELGIYLESLEEPVVANIYINMLELYKKFLILQMPKKQEKSLW